LFAVFPGVLSLSYAVAWLASDSPIRSPIHPKRKTIANLEIKKQAEWNGNGVVQYLC
jgi:hypothetical protein